MNDHVEYCSFAGSNNDSGSESSNDKSFDDVSGMTTSLPTTSAAMMILATPSPANSGDEKYDDGDEDNDEDDDKNDDKDVSGDNDDNDDDEGDDGIDNDDSYVDTSYDDGSSNDPTTAR